MLTRSTSADLERHKAAIVLDHVKSVISGTYHAIGQPNYAHRYLPIAAYLVELPIQAC